MSFGSKVERWRQLVEELAPDLPSDLVLGIIWHESRGTPGILSGGTTKPALVPTATGMKKATHAFGLMQVIPRNVATWNNEHPADLATWELMSGTSSTAARMQIRLGVWILRESLAWCRLYGFLWPDGPLSDDQIKIALMVYAWGGHNLAPYLDQLVQEGTPVTAAAIATRWPDMGAPKNAPVKFSQRVWNKAFGGGAGATVPAPVTTTPAPTPIPGRKSGAVVGLLLLGAALYWATKNTSAPGR
jgi:hypothetical protein